MDEETGLAKWYAVFGIIALAAFLFLGIRTADAATCFFIEAHQGIKINDAPWGASNWQGKYPTSISAGIRWTRTCQPYADAKFNHTSNVLDGPPFNDRDETWLDALMFGGGYEWKLGR